MGIGDALLLVSCLAGLMFALPALLIFMNLALLTLSDHATARLNRGGIVPFFAGLLPVIFIGIPAAGLIAAGSVFQFFGSLIMLILLFWGFMGLAVVARLVGQRLTAMYEREESPFIQTVAGSLVLSFSIAFPLIGWLLILPFSLIIGIGATLLVTLRGIWNFLFGRAPAPTVITMREQWQQS
jgi:hypothetical protein